jgi:acyl carrier protein
MTLHERLEEVFREVFNDERLSLTDETSSRDISDWDSVAHINLMFSIEQTFRVEFTGNQLAQLQNIGELKRFLVSRGCA